MGSDCIRDAVLVDAHAHIALLLVGASKHCRVFVGRKCDETARVRAGVDSINQFQVRKVVHINSVLKDNNNSI